MADHTSTQDAPPVPAPDGGPAYPQPLAADGLGRIEYTEVEGMSLRDWFAGQAIIGLLSDSERHGHLKEYAEIAYELADFMLAEREK